MEEDRSGIMGENGEFIWGPIGSEVSVKYL